MIQLLLQRGASFDGMRIWGGTGPYVLEMTDHLSYHSMSEILRREHGFEIIAPLPGPYKQSFGCWHKWRSIGGTIASCRCSYDDDDDTW
jgi:hypothetical protein